MMHVVSVFIVIIICRFMSRKWFEVINLRQGKNNLLIERL